MLRVGRVIKEETTRFRTTKCLNMRSNRNILTG